MSFKNDGTKWFFLGIAAIILAYFVAFGIVLYSHGQNLPSGCHVVDPFDCYAATAKEGSAPHYFVLTVKVGGQDSAEISWGDGTPNTPVSKSGNYDHWYNWSGSFVVKFTAKNSWDKKSKDCCVVLVKDKPKVELDCWSDSDGGVEPFIAKITVKIAGATESYLYFMRDGKVEKTISNLISGDYYETLSAGKWTVKFWGRNAYEEKQKECCEIDVKQKEIDCAWLPTIRYAKKDRPYLPLKYALTPRTKDGKLIGYILNVWGRGTKRNGNIKIESYYQLQKMGGPGLKNDQEYLTIETWPLPDRSGGDGRYLLDQFEVWFVRDLSLPLNSLITILFKVRCENCGTDFVFNVSTLNPLRGIAYYFPQAAALR